MKKWQNILFILLVIFISVELYLRLYWGFCDSVLMIYSDKYEYIAQPNQDRIRFRNHIHYNSFSMRSEEVDTSATIILGFGDSIFNGGVAVDQDSTAAYILTDQLSKNNSKRFQVLNVSAGSWGPDNCFAYLKEKGDFDAKMIFLVVSSHDANDNMDFTPVIDNVIRYESKQYKIAIWELIDKYLIPRIKNNLPSEVFGINKNGTHFNTGFIDLYHYCDNKKIPFFIYLNPDQNEVSRGEYSEKGKSIIDFCIKHNIECIQGLHHTIASDYRGIIHLNNSGQKKMASLIFNSILEKNKQFHSIKQ